jgi:hypothetical protein
MSMPLFDREKEFLSKLKDNHGFIGRTLKDLEMTRSEFDEMMTDIFFTKKVLEIQELSVDYVEERLLEMINEGNISAIQFFLKTKGQKRGYK